MPKGEKTMEAPKAPQQTNEAVHEAGRVRHMAGVVLHFAGEVFSPVAHVTVAALDVAVHVVGPYPDGVPDRMSDYPKTGRMNHFRGPVEPYNSSLAARHPVVPVERVSQQVA